MSFAKNEWELCGGGNAYRGGDRVRLVGCGTRCGLLRRVGGLLDALLRVLLRWR